MRTGSRRPLVLLALVAIVLVAGPAPQPSAHVVWEARLTTADGLPIVEALVADRGPWRFAIDTGAEASSVSPALARRLGLPAAGTIDDHTMAGVSRIPLVALEGLRIGPAGPATRVAQAGVVDLSRFEGNLDGVLGGDVLREFEYLIDFGRGRLTLSRGVTLGAHMDPGAVRLPIEFDRDRPIVSWPRGAGRPGLPLVLDTGSAALVVDRLEASAFPCEPRTEETLRLETHAGSRPVVACRVAGLAATDLVRRNEPGAALRLVSVTWPTAPARRDRGLLPGSAFAAVSVSRLRGTLALWPR